MKTKIQIRLLQPACSQGITLWRLNKASPYLSTLKFALTSLLKAVTRLKPRFSRSDYHSSLQTIVFMTKNLLHSRIPLPQLRKQECSMHNTKMRYIACFSSKNHHRSHSNSTRKWNVQILSISKFKTDLPIFGTWQHQKLASNKHRIYNTTWKT